MAKMTTTQVLTGIKNWVLGKIANITALIPLQASPSNQLADKAFVNSSIATATATFRGTYNVVTDLSLSYAATHSQIASALATKMTALSIVADNNDYAYVQIPTADATPAEIAKIEKYKYNGSAWAFEYELNNSGFTAEQWAAINSGATLELIGKLAALPTNAELTTLLNAKASKVINATAGNLAGLDAIGNLTDLGIGLGDNGAYDVTAHNSGATFASLSALLNSDNLSTLIPVDVRYGGMSIKFVLTSDNNSSQYVQCRYMGTSTDTADFTNPANWQGVDYEPTAGSENLVQSGGTLKSDLLVKAHASLLNYDKQTAQVTMTSDTSRVNTGIYVYKNRTYIIKCTSITSRNTDDYAGIYLGDTGTPFVRISPEEFNNGFVTENIIPTLQYIRTQLYIRTGTNGDIVDIEVYDVTIEKTIPHRIAENQKVFVCTDIEGIYNRSITVPDFVLANGVYLKVKMEHKIMDSRCNLQINDTASKILYYNDAQANTANSWADGEVLNVYYDETNDIYIAYNANVVSTFKTNEKLKDVSIDRSIIANSPNIPDTASVYDSIARSEYLTAKTIVTPNIISKVQNAGNAATEATPYSGRLLEGHTYVIYCSCPTAEGADTHNDAGLYFDNGDGLKIICKANKSKFNNGFVCIFTPSVSNILFSRLYPAAANTDIVYFEIFDITNVKEKVNKEDDIEQKIKQSILSEAFAFSNFQYTNGNLSSAIIKWFDGTTGTMTITYSGNNISYIDYTYGSSTYRQTINYTNGEITGNQVVKL